MKLYQKFIIVAMAFTMLGTMGILIKGGLDANEKYRAWCAAKGGVEISIKGDQDKGLNVCAKVEILK